MSKTLAPKTTPASKPAEGRTAAKTGKSTAKPKAAAVADPDDGVTTLEATAPSPGSSRFADRFAPPKPPTRSMSTPVIESPKTAAKADPKLANAWKTKPGHELTDAEVLAMPEAEYMNDKQIEFFRAKLNELKEGVLSNAGETTEHLREDTSIVPDPADRATIEEEHALELRTRDRERKLLKKIMQSLTRLDSGDYGYCDETGEPIGLGRLIARPTATLSLEAQQRRELKQKMFGD
ncbi:RNA polymerase-binding protein DksA [Roseateles sp. DAIF2]|uniref:RNA polymerase-binding protein DksA n=1 Tax=Roseateles sp. DAIF2 TaxID=2714952 RepID=UPI00201E3572|nr:RNA polymerase-binding protein DksA [Roseateles sp. DAIF2]